MLGMLIFYRRRFPGLGLNVREAKKKDKKDERWVLRIGYRTEDGRLVAFFRALFFNVVFWEQAKKVRVAVLGRLFGDACEKAVGTCTCTFEVRVVVVGKGRDVAVRVPGVRAHTHTRYNSSCVSHL